MDKELGIYKDDLEKGEYLKNIMIARATNEESNEEDYKELRRYFINYKKDIVPDIVRQNRDFNQFWEFIKYKYSHYDERRRYIHSEFNDFLEKLEEEIMPNSEDVKNAMKNMDSSLILAEWNKALDRKKDDPEGAITISKSLLESVLKHILDDLDIRYTTKEDLPQLYKKVSKQLNLYPEQHEEESFKKILGSCANIINELSNIRNGVGDAHGKGRKVYRPSERHAGLVVNLSGTMALFLIQTFENNRT